MILLVKGPDGTGQAERVALPLVVPQEALRVGVS